MDPIVVDGAVRVPPRALSFHAVRASGPGGQNVNRVATKVELRVDLGAIEGLGEAARRRLLTLAGHRLDADGHLVLTSQTSRSQAENLEDARARVRRLIAAALVRPKPRRTTRPTGASRERRIAGKKQRGAVKRLRSDQGDWP